MIIACLRNGCLNFVLLLEMGVLILCDYYD